VQKSVESESFFHLFSDTDVQEDKLDKLDEEEMEQVVERMDIDWSIAEQLEEEVVPYSVEYYLNVITKMPEDYEGIDDSEEEELPKKKKECKGCC
jgi:nucleosome assembly protein 1-like 1